MDLRHHWVGNAPFHSNNETLWLADLTDVETAINLLKNGTQNGRLIYYNKSYSYNILTNTKLFVEVNNRNSNMPQSKNIRI